MKKKSSIRKMYIMAGTLSCLGCIAMMVFPSVALNAARKGIALWASSVLPALLPFFICANFMTAIGLPAHIGKILESPFRRLFRAPGLAAFVFSVSITSGYPMGAKLIGDFGREGMITRSDAKRMLTFCSTSGPLFMLGAVGAGMLASPAAGAVIALSHYIGAVLNGFLFRFYGSDTQEQRANLSAKMLHGAKKGSLLDLFTDSMILSFRALGIICGYIVLFMMITDFIAYSGLLNGITSDSLKNLVKGGFEMTVGCSGIAHQNDITLLYQCIFCAFLISFGGLSVYAQSMSMLAGLKIGSGFYLVSKLIHGVLAAAVAWLIGPALLNAETMAVFTWNREEFIGRLGFFYQLLFSAEMVIMIVILFMMTILLDKMLDGIRRRLKERKAEKSAGDSSGDSL